MLESQRERVRTAAEQARRTKPEAARRNNEQKRGNNSKMREKIVKSLLARMRNPFAEQDSGEQEMDWD